MNVFEAVRAANISAKDAAERYAGAVFTQKGRRHWACCPLHREKTASFCVSGDGRWHCFGSCSAGGDATAFAAAYFGVSPLEAAKLLARDFGVEYSQHRDDPKAANKRRKKQGTYGVFEGWLAESRRALEGRLEQIDYAAQNFAPASPDEEADERFVQALICREQVEYMADTLAAGSIGDKLSLFREDVKRKVVQKYAEQNTAG